MTNINMSALGVYLSTVYQHDFFIEIEGRPVSIEKVLQEYKKVKGLEQSDLLTEVGLSGLLKMQISLDRI